MFTSHTLGRRSFNVVNLNGCQIISLPGRQRANLPGVPTSQAGSGFNIHL